MRIVAGHARGLRLSGPDKKMNARPTLDRVREALFNIINADGKSVLDLFSGSGAVGCEAASRGANRVMFVEQGKRAVALIGKNLAAVIGILRNSPGVTEGGLPMVDIEATDAFRFLKNPPAGVSFDYIFADPPYEMEELPELPGLILSSGLMEPDGTLILEVSKRRVDEMPEAGRIKKYGDCVLLFYYGAKRQ